jgi:hypothetical protein
MRVEPAPYVFRNEDRRGRFADRRASAERRADEPVTKRRAQHSAHVWFTPTFGAHLLGQAAGGRIIPASAARAYSQPEARTPLRPSLVKSV